MDDAKRGQVEALLHRFEPRMDAARLVGSRTAAFLALQQADRLTSMMALASLMLTLAYAEHRDDALAAQYATDVVAAMGYALIKGGKVQAAEAN